MKYWIAAIVTMFLSSSSHAQIGYINCVVARPLPLPDILQNLLDAEQHKDTKNGRPSSQGDENCRMAPASTRCVHYKSRQIEIEKSCMAYFRQVLRTSCWYEKRLPRACERYRKSAQEKFQLNAR
jgi:hypothetical protein